MKKNLIVFFSLITSIQLFAGYREVVIITGNGGFHSGQPLFPADQPAVYYDDVNQQIIIDGTGEADYYDVEVNSLSTFDQLIGTRVSGSYATIDVSSLPDDDYEIIITSSLNNVYEGYFCRLCFRP